MAKNLTREQNEMLGHQKEATEKFQLLEEWLDKEEITREQYNDCIRRIINRAMKNLKPEVPPALKKFYKASEEALLQALIEKLRTKLNSYLASRNNIDADLSNEDIDLFQRYLKKYSHVKTKINQLLIIGLRYPDHNINKISENYIKEYRISRVFTQSDFNFWATLWADDNFVPMNAIRLMLSETNEEVKLNPYFDQNLINELRPLIEYQRDKEILRLQWAQSLKNEETRNIETKRKQQRLDMFNLLLKIS